ncbi:MAG: hypothetical protein WAQ98_02610, partial [Blastocatellia bacterium]
MKSKNLPLLNGIFLDSQTNNSYEEENSWLIEIITIAYELTFRKGNQKLWNFICMSQKFIRNKK